MTVITKDTCEKATQVQSFLGFVFSLKNDELGTRNESPKNRQQEVDTGRKKRPANGLLVFHLPASEFSHHFHRISHVVCVYSDPDE